MSQVVTAPSEAPSPQKPPRRRSRVVAFCLAGALVYFFGPAVAFLLGDRPEEIDNRPLAAFPTAGDGWSALAQFQLWANDHLPLRSQSVALATGISETIFNEPPRFGAASSSTVAGVGAGAGAEPSGDSDGTPVAYPTVIEGPTGWLFSGDDVAMACTPKRSVSEIMDGFQRLADAARESGRTIVITIAPDKSRARPDELPDSFAGSRCMEERRSAFWTAAAKLEGVELHDPSDDLAAYERATGRVAWRTLDTHWSPEGAAVFAKSIARELDPELAQDSQVQVGPLIDARGDLTSLQGASRTEQVHSATLQRPGVALSLDGVPVDPIDVPDLGYSPVTVTADSTGAELYPGRTLVIGDSFFRTARSSIAGLFESMTYVHNLAPDETGGTEAVAGALADSDTLVYELGERLAVGGYVAFQDRQQVDALVAAMLANPRG